MTRPRFTENKSYLEGPQTRPNPVNRPIIAVHVPALVARDGAILRGQGGISNFWLPIGITSVDGEARTE